VIELGRLIPDHIQANILAWVLAEADCWDDWGMPATKWFRPWWSGLDPLPAFYEAKAIVAERCNFERFQDEDRRRYSQLSCTREGGGVAEHDHIDLSVHDPAYYLGKADCRINTLIQAPIDGADLMVDNVSFDPPPEGHAWTFDAFKKHSVYPVIGDRPRVVVSFGFHMPKADYREFCERVSQ